MVPLATQGAGALVSGLLTHQVGRQGQGELHRRARSLAGHQDPVPDHPVGPDGRSLIDEFAVPQAEALPEVSSFRIG